MEHFPSLTKQWHGKSYGAIDPTQAALSKKGKVVVISGGGGSVGRATALAFARAGCQQIAVFGRRAGPLNGTKKVVEEQVPGVHVLVVQGDMADAKSTDQAFEKIGTEFGEINVLVANAGYLPSFGTVAGADPDEWFKGFELNTRGAFNLIRAFLPLAGDDPIMVDVSTSVVHMPALPGGSAYTGSKLAATKVYQVAGAENPQLTVFHVHPGLIESELSVKSGVVATDDADLPGDFINWVCSDEGRFLKGKYLWSNWDVDELKARKDELSQPHQLIITMNGWPFPYEAPTGIALH